MHEVNPRRTGKQGPRARKGSPAANLSERLTGLAIGAEDPDRSGPPAGLSVSAPGGKCCGTREGAKTKGLEIAF